MNREGLLVDLLCGSGHFGNQECLVTLNVESSVFAKFYGSVLKGFVLLG